MSIIIPHKIPRNRTAQIIIDICSKHGLSFWIEPEYGFMGYIEHPEFGRRYFSNNHLWVNSDSVANTATDKSYTIKLLNLFGYSTPRGDYFFCDDLNKVSQKKRGMIEALEYAKSLGFPLIVKPNDKSQGLGVQKVWDEESLKESIDDVFKISSILRIEQFITGGDYRIVVLDDTIICAYERIPLYVIGNGKNSIKDLLTEKIKVYESLGRVASIRLDDPRIINNLIRKDYSLDSILEKDTHLQLLDNGNLSTGGECMDISDTLHNDYKDLAIGISKSLGLRLSGIDIKSTSIFSSIDHTNREYSILEVNSAPGFIDYISLGEEQKERIYNMFNKMIIDT